MSRLVPISFDTWLSGTTCYRHRRAVLLENETHIILKHFAHAEYTTRMTGVVNCPAYAKLYPKTAKIDRIDHSQLLVWTGRTSIKRIIADCLAIGVIFQLPTKITGDNHGNI